MVGCHPNVIHTQHRLIFMTLYLAQLCDVIQSKCNHELAILSLIERSVFMQVVHLLVIVENEQN